MGDTGGPLIQILRKPPQEAAVAEPAAAVRGAVEWPAVAERLRRLASARAGQSPSERCELCGAAVEPEHGHLVNVASRTLLCACRPCYLLFTHDGAGGARFRAVPDRYQLLAGFGAAAEDWEALQIPIGLAFFFRNSATGRTTAFYPSPAGATESELPLDAWDAMVRAVPPLSTLAADVEALLVRRWTARPGGPDDGLIALIVPIDACYELVGRIRSTWRGVQGGDEVWRAIDGFFARAAERARADGAVGR